MQRQVYTGKNPKASDNSNITALSSGEISRITPGAVKLNNVSSQELAGHVAAGRVQKESKIVSPEEAKYKARRQQRDSVKTVNHTVDQMGNVHEIGFKAVPSDRRQIKGNSRMSQTRANVLTTLFGKVLNALTRR